MKALLLENIHSDGIELLESRGVEVDSRPDALGERDLIAALEGVDLLGIRSATHVTEEVIAARPDLAVGSPSLRWVAAAFSAMAVAATDRYPGSVRIPTLMLAAARDRVVSTAAIETLGLRMRTGRHLVIAGAQHEMFMDTNPIRGQVLAAFDAFVTEPSV